MARVKIEKLHTHFDFPEGDFQATAPDFHGSNNLTVHDLPWDNSVYLEITSADGQEIWENIIIKRKHWDKLVEALSKGEDK